MTPLEILAIKNALNAIKAAKDILDYRIDVSGYTKKNLNELTVIEKENRNRIGFVSDTMLYQSQRELEALLQTYEKSTARF